MDYLGFPLQADEKRELEAGGLEVKTTDLPNYIVPPFNGIGANEYIVDVTHELPGPDGKRSSRRWISLDGGHALRLGIEHVVSHAERRLSHAHQR